MFASTDTTRRITGLSGLLALISWWALFHFQGVTDIGYLAHKANPSAFTWLFFRWQVDWHATHYAINFLAPALALWLLWRRRDRLRAGSYRVAWTGAAVVLLGLALHILGAKAQQTRLSLIGMVLLLWGAPWFAWGPLVGRTLRYPALALFFSLPLNFFDQALNPIRVAAARISAGLAAGLGLNVKAIGSLLVDGETGSWTLDLADSTSSIYALLALTLWTLFRAELRLPDARRKIWLLLWTPVLFVLATILRGAALALLAEGWSAPLAQTLHDRTPALLLFLLFFAMQTGVLRLLALNRNNLRQRIEILLKPHGAPSSSTGREGLP